MKFTQTLVALVFASFVVASPASRRQDPTPADAVAPVDAGTDAAVDPTVGALGSLRRADLPDEGDDVGDSDKIPVPLTDAQTRRQMASSGNVDFNQCNNGQVQCCQRVEHANDSPAAAVIGFLGPSARQQASVGQIGVGCTPAALTATGLIGCAAQTQTACCTNNNYHGMVAFGCSLIAPTFF